MPSHFKLLVFFALIISVVLGALTRPASAERVKYILRSFALFILVGIGIAWLLYPFSH